MPDIASETLDLIFQLLPGFFTAWVLYGLTAYKRPQPFERVVQALVFTAVVQAFAIIFRESVFLVGKWKHFGVWTDDSTHVANVSIALVLGVGLAYAANRNIVHNKLWNWGITNGSSYPSEWYKTLVENPRFVILHLSDGRRLYGWPSDYPDYPGEGHFGLSQCEWLLDDGRRMPIHQTALFLVSANKVDAVEFLNNPDEILVSPEEMETTRLALVELHGSPDIGSYHKRKVLDGTASEDNP